MSRDGPGSWTNLHVLKRAGGRPRRLGEQFARSSSRWVLSQELKATLPGIEIWLTRHRNCGGQELGRAAAQRLSHAQVFDGAPRRPPRGRPRPAPGARAARGRRSASTGSPGCVRAPPHGLVAASEGCPALVKQMDEGSGGLPRGSGTMAWPRRAARGAGCDSAGRAGAALETAARRTCALAPKARAPPSRG